MTATANKNQTNALAPSLRRRGGLTEEAATEE